MNQKLDKHLLYYNKQHHFKVNFLAKRELGSKRGPLFAIQQSYSDSISQSGIVTKRCISTFASKRDNNYYTDKDKVVSITYEEIGLFPRSFSRVLDRFLKQLFSDVDNLVIQEYRFYRYLFLTTIKTIFILFFVPFVVNYVAKNYIIKPMTEYFWNTSHPEIFLNSYEQKRAFAELEKFEEKIYFEALVDAHSQHSMAESHTWPASPPYKAPALQGMNGINLESPFADAKAAPRPLPLLAEQADNLVNKNESGLSRTFSGLTFFYDRLAGQVSPSASVSPAEMTQYNLPEIPLLNLTVETKEPTRVSTVTNSLDAGNISLNKKESVAGSQIISDIGGAAATKALDGQGPSLEYALAGPTTRYNIIRKNKDISKIYQEKTIELATYYNNHSIEAITNFFADLLSLCTLLYLLITLEIQINITKSFLLEVFFGLDDSKKSLLILLVTDLLVGYHSSNLWELFFEFIFNHYGIPESQTGIFLLVATLPVLLDVLFKYLIFRHLNRSSPATVATYQAILE